MSELLWGWAALTLYSQHWKWCRWCKSYSSDDISRMYPPEPLFAQSQSYSSPTPFAILPNTNVCNMIVRGSYKVEMLRVRRARQYSLEHLTWEDAPVDRVGMTLQDTETIVAKTQKLELSSSDFTCFHLFLNMFCLQFLRSQEFENNTCQKYLSFLWLLWGILN